MNDELPTISEEKKEKAWKEAASLIWQVQEKYGIGLNRAERRRRKKRADRK